MERIKKISFLNNFFIRIGSYLFTSALIKVFLFTISLFFSFSLIYFITDLMFHLNNQWNWILFLGLIILIFLSIIKLKYLLVKRSKHDSALVIEKCINHNENIIVNSSYYINDSNENLNSIKYAVINESFILLNKLKTISFLFHFLNKRLIFAFFTGLIFFFSAFQFSGNEFFNSLTRLLTPWSNTPPITRTKITPIPIDMELNFGSDFNISFKAHGKIPDSAVLKIFSINKKIKKEITAKINSDNTFSFSIKKVQNSFNYQISLGDLITRKNKVKIIPKPLFLKEKIKISYPHYMKKDNLYFNTITDNLNYYPGSLIDININTDRSLNNLTLKSKSTESDLNFKKVDSKSWSLKLKPEKGDNFTFYYGEKEAESLELDKNFKLSALIDYPPKVELFSSRSEIQPEDIFFNLKITARDDILINKLILKYKFSDEKEWKIYKTYNPQKKEFTHEELIPVDKIKKSNKQNSLIFVGEASDFNPNNNISSKSSQLEIPILNTITYKFHLVKKYYEKTIILKNEIISFLLDKKQTFLFKPFLITFQNLHQNLKIQKISNINLFRNTETIEKILNNFSQVKISVLINQLIILHNELNPNIEKLIKALLVEILNNLKKQITRNENELYFDYININNQIFELYNFFKTSTNPLYANILNKALEKFHSDQLIKNIKDNKNTPELKKQLIKTIDNTLDVIFSIKLNTDYFDKDKVTTLLKDEINYLKKLSLLIKSVNTEIVKENILPITDLILYSSEKLSSIKKLAPDLGIKGNTLLESAFFDANLMLDLINRKSAKKALSKRKKSTDAIDKCRNSLETVYNRLNRNNSSTIKRKNIETINSNIQKQENDFIEIISPDNGSSYSPFENVNFNIQGKSLAGFEQLWIDIEHTDQRSNTLKTSEKIREFSTIPDKINLEYVLQLSKHNFSPGILKISFRGIATQDNQLKDIESKQILINIAEINLSRTLSETLRIKEELSQQYEHLKEKALSFLIIIRNLEKNIITTKEDLALNIIFPPFQESFSEFHILERTIKSELQKKNLKSVENAYVAINEQNNNLKSIFNSQKKNLLYLINTLQEQPLENDLILPVIIEIKSQSESIIEIIDFIKNTLISDIIRSKSFNNSPLSNLRGFINNLEQQIDILSDQSLKDNSDIFTFIINKGYITRLSQLSRTIDNFPGNKFDQLIEKYISLAKDNENSDENKALFAEFCHNLISFINQSNKKNLKSIVKNSENIIASDKKMQIFQDIINDLSKNDETYVAADILLAESKLKGINHQQSTDLLKILTQNLSEEDKISLFKTRFNLLSEKLNELADKKEITKGESDYILKLTELIDILNVNFEIFKEQAEIPENDLKEIQTRINNSNDILIKLRKVIEESRASFERHYEKERNNLLEEMLIRKNEKSFAIKELILFINRTIDKLITNPANSNDSFIKEALLEFFSFFNQLSRKEQEVFSNHNNFHLRFFNLLFYFDKAFKNNKEVFLKFYQKQLNLLKAEFKLLTPPLHHSNVNRSFNNLKNKAIKNVRSALKEKNKKLKEYQEKLTELNKVLNKTVSDIEEINNLKRKISELSLEIAEQNKEIANLRTIRNIDIDIEKVARKETDILSELKINDKTKIKSTKKENNKEGISEMIIRNFSEELEEIENSGKSLDYKNKRLSILAERVTLYSGKETKSDKIKDTIDQIQQEQIKKEKSDTTADLLASLADAAENYEFSDSEKEIEKLNPKLKKFRFLEQAKAKSNSINNTINLLDSQSLLTEKLNKLAEKLDSINEELTSIENNDVNADNIEFEEVTKQLKTVTDVLLNETKVILAPYKPNLIKLNDKNKAVITINEKDYTEFSAKINDYLAIIAGNN